MKPADARRAAILVYALKSLASDLRPALRRTKPAESWDFYGMRIGVADITLGQGGDFSGVDPRAWIDIDIETARMLAPLLRRLIVDELRKLGVEP